VIGIFDYGAGLETSYPPEEEIQLDNQYRGKGGMIGWATENISSAGYLNLITVLGKRNPDASPKAKGMAYAYTELTSPDKRVIKITLGSNDGAKMWINGDIIYNRHVGRNAVPDQDILDVKLK